MVEGVLSLVRKGAPITADGVSYTHPVSLGGCLLEDLVDMTDVLAAAEGEERPGRPE